MHKAHRLRKIIRNENLGPRCALLLVLLHALLLVLVLGSAYDSAAIGKFLTISEV